MTHSRRFRSQSVVLGLTLVGAAAFTSGCSASDEYQGICVDPETELRLDDDACDDVDEDTYYDGTGGGAYWFFVHSGNSAPAVGQRYNSSSGVYRPPSGVGYSKGGISKSGGTVSRGGFGSGFGKSSS